MKHRVAGGLAALLLAVGGWQCGEALWIHAKAVLAQVPHQARLGANPR